MVACTTGMKTPSTSTVTSTVAIAANDGTALRVSARTASWKKKPNLIVEYPPWASSRITWPSDSSITRRRMRSTIDLSWVATITVVPVRLIR